MDLLRSRATSKAKMVICLNNTTKGVLCVLNLSRNRLLIIFARLPALFQKLKNWRSKSALFRALGASVPVRFLERGLLPMVIHWDCIGVYGGIMPPHGKPQAVNNRGLSALMQTQDTRKSSFLLLYQKEKRQDRKSSQLRHALELVHLQL